MNNKPKFNRLNMTNQTVGGGKLGGESLAGQYTVEVEVEENLVDLVSQNVFLSYFYLQLA